MDGQLLADAEAPAVRIVDHGFTVGDGVFEALKVVDGEPFALQRHLDRLLVSAEGLGLPEPDVGAVRAGIDAVLGAEHLALGRIRITVTGGPAPLGSGRGSTRPRSRSSPLRWIPRPPRRRWRWCRGRATSAGRWRG